MIMTKFKWSLVLAAGFGLTACYVHGPPRHGYPPPPQDAPAAAPAPQPAPEATPQAVSGEGGSRRAPEAPDAPPPDGTGSTRRAPEAPDGRPAGPPPIPGETNGPDLHQGHSGSGTRRAPPSGGSGVRVEVRGGHSHHGAATGGSRRAAPAPSGPRHHVGSQPRTAPGSGARHRGNSKRAGTQPRRATPTGYRGNSRRAGTQPRRATPTGHRGNSKRAGTQPRRATPTGYRGNSKRAGTQPRRATPTGRRGHSKRMGTQSRRAKPTGERSSRRVRQAPKTAAGKTVGGKKRIDHDKHKARKAPVKPQTPAKK